MDFLGFSCRNRDFSMGYEGKAGKDFFWALFRDGTPWRLGDRTETGRLSSPEWVVTGQWRFMRKIIAQFL